MTTRKRRTTARRRTGTTRRRPTRRRTSTSSTLGTAVGVALAGLLAAALGGLPWWGWVLLVLAGLAGGLIWAAARARATEPAGAGPEPAAEPERPA